MQNDLTIVMGIARYEFKRHWRRKALIVIMLSLTLIVGLSILLSSDLETLANFSDVEQQNVDKAVSLTVALVTWIPMSVLLIFVLPVAVADTIPLDTQYRVKDILFSTQLTPATYLAGKLMGLWLATLAGLSVVMVIITALWVWQIGTFDFSLYAEIWLINAVSITVLNGSLGVLLAVGQPNRRRAVVVVIGLFMTLTFILNFNFGELWTLGSPVRLPMMTYFIPQADQETLATTVFNREVMLTIAIGFIQLGMIWTIAWGWLKYRESHD